MHELFKCLKLPLNRLELKYSPSRDRVPNGCYKGVNDLNILARKINANFCYFKTSLEERGPLRKVKRKESSEALLPL